MCAHTRALLNDDIDLPIFDQHINFIKAWPSAYQKLRADRPGITLAGAIRHRCFDAMAQAASRLATNGEDLDRAAMEGASAKGPFGCGSAIQFALENNILAALAALIRNRCLAAPAEVISAYRAWKTGLQYKFLWLTSFIDCIEVGSE